MSIKYSNPRSAIPSAACIHPSPLVPSPRVPRKQRSSRRHRNYHMGERRYSSLWEYKGLFSTLRGLEIGLVRAYELVEHCDHSPRRTPMQRRGPSLNVTRLDQPWVIWSFGGSDFSSSHRSGRKVSPSPHTRFKRFEQMKGMTILYRDVSH